jgi:hypothetical protein
MRQTHHAHVQRLQLHTHPRTQQATVFLCLPSRRSVAGCPMLLHAALGSQGDRSQGQPNLPHLSTTQQPHNNNKHVSTLTLHCSWSATAARNGNSNTASPFWPHTLPSKRSVAGCPVLLHAALGGQGHSSQGQPKSHLKHPPHNKEFAPNAL